MRRGVQADLVTGFGQNGEQGRADRSLAISSADVDTGKLLLRIVKPAKKVIHGIKSELDLEKLQIIEKGPGLLVVHFIDIRLNFRLWFIVEDRVGIFELWRSQGGGFCHHDGQRQFPLVSGREYF